MVRHQRVRGGESCVAAMAARTGSISASLSPPPSSPFAFSFCTSGGFSLFAALSWLLSPSPTPLHCARWWDGHSRCDRRHVCNHACHRYNLEVMQLLGMTYDLHGEMIKDAGCLQPNKIDIVKRKSRDGDVAQIVVQTLTMQGSPFTNDSCDNLVTAGELFRFQPHMTQRQLCILCLGDSTLITIVKDNMVGTGQDDFGSDVVIDLDGSVPVWRPLLIAAVCLSW